MPELDSLTDEQRKRVEEKIRSIATKIESRRTYHSIRDCEDCRYEPCAIQFELWDLERELERWRQQPLQEIENEDTARRQEDEYFVRLTTSHARVLSRFVEIVESKITIDDYGDEVISHLGREIDVCIDKLKSREGVARFAPSLETRLRAHLSQLFARQHAQKKHSSTSS